jgi:hypothetical protein
MKPGKGKEFKKKRKGHFSTAEMSWKMLQIHREITAGHVKKRQASQKVIVKHRGRQTQQIC